MLEIFFRKICDQDISLKFKFSKRICDGKEYARKQYAGDSVTLPNFKAFSQLAYF